MIEKCWKCGMPFHTGGCGCNPTVFGPQEWQWPKKCDLCDAKDATIARLTTENKRFRQERDDQFWARGHELKELIAARTALDEANRKYERAYDCHGQACGACIACCAEIIYDLTIRKDMAREDGYRQGWEHCKQVQDSFNEATIAVSRKFQEDLLEILTIVENDNDPDWSKVQKVKGIMLKHHIEEDEEMYDG